MQSVGKARGGRIAQALYVRGQEKINMKAAGGNYSLRPVDLRKGYPDSNYLTEVFPHFEP